MCWESTAVSNNTLTHLVHYNYYSTARRITKITMAQKELLIEAIADSEGLILHKMVIPTDLRNVHQVAIKKVHKGAKELMSMLREGKCYEVTDEDEHIPNRAVVIEMDSAEGIEYYCICTDELTSAQILAGRLMETVAAVLEKEGSGRVS